MSFMSGIFIAEILHNICKIPERVKESYNI